MLQNHIFERFLTGEELWVKDSEGSRGKFQGLGFSYQTQRSGFQRDWVLVSLALRLRVYLLPKKFSCFWGGSLRWFLHMTREKGWVWGQQVGSGSQGGCKCLFAFPDV